MPKNCFVISPIGAEASDVRRNADLLFTYILKPTLNACGYEALRADMMPVAGMINSHIIRHIVEDELAIADLTGRNPNVFYELAIRHVIGKPYIHLIRDGESIPFDVHDVHTIFYSIDVSKIEKAQERIKEQILYFERGNPVTSPFTMTMDFLATQRPDTTQQQLREVMEHLQRLERSIKDLPPKAPDQDRSELIATLEERIEAIKLEIVTKLSEKISQIDRTPSPPAQSVPAAPQGSTSQTDYQNYQDRSQGVPARRIGKEFTISEWLDLQERERARNPKR